MRSGLDLELVTSGLNPLIPTLNQFPSFRLVLFISSVMSIIPLSTFSFMQPKMPLSGPLFRLLMKRSREKERLREERTKRKRNTCAAGESKGASQTRRVRSDERGSFAFEVFGGRVFL